MNAMKIMAFRHKLQDNFTFKDGSTLREYCNYSASQIV